jgi:hypothetical protein
LWFRSKYIPQALAGIEVVASGFCVVCTVAFLLFPGFEAVVNLWWFDMPMGIFDIATSIRLLVRGLRPLAT